MMIRCTLLGVGAMNSPLYRPAGLLVSYQSRQIMLDGGPGAEPTGPVEAWLVCDESAELAGPIRRLADGLGVAPSAADHDLDELHVRRCAVEHTSHPTYGYLLTVGRHRVVWAPEFWRFPDWADGADLMFADAAGWTRPIRFRGGVGGHACVSDVAEEAQRRGIRRLVFAHIGRPSIRARRRGEIPSFGSWGEEGHTYTVG